MAGAPPAALPGIPTFSPGSIDMTTPPPAVLPPEVFGPSTGAGRKAARAPVSPALPPWPTPFPTTLGGGGTTPGPPLSPRAKPAASGLPSANPAVGCTGGGTTFLVPSPKNEPAADQISLAKAELVLGAGCTAVGGGNDSLGCRF